MRARTYEAGVVFDVLAHVGDTCGVFVGAMTRACDFDVAVLYMCVCRRCKIAQHLHKHRPKRL